MTATKATVTINPLPGPVMGNDFAMDDVSLVLVGPTQKEATMTVADLITQLGAGNFMPHLE